MPHTEVVGVGDPVTHTAVLPVAEETVLFVSRLLVAERRRRGIRGRRRALGCYRQAVLLLRWCIDGTRLAQLATGNAIGRSTAYRYLYEGIDVLAAAAPGLRGALLAARAAGHAHVTVDGTRAPDWSTRVIDGPTEVEGLHGRVWFVWTATVPPHRADGSPGVAPSTPSPYGRRWGHSIVQKSASGTPNRLCAPIGVDDGLLWVLPGTRSYSLRRVAGTARLDG